MAAGRNESVRPNGNPQTARTCCSNWLVDAAFDRPMPGIVRPRSKLVDDQFAVALQEHLHRQQSDEIEAPRDFARELAGRFGNVVRNSRRREGDIENVIGDEYFRKRERLPFCRPVRAPR